MSRARPTSRSSKRVQGLLEALDALLPNVRQPGKVEPFSGRSDEFPASQLPEGLFQEDENGDRTKKGSWRRRRGMTRNTLVDTQAAPVVTFLGFESEEFSLLVISGTNILGFPAPGTPAITVDISGYGEIRYGEDGFGE